MGGCASKPKELDNRPNPLPSEAPGSPKKAEGENATQVNSDGGESQKEEAPPVDVSEPNQASEEKPADAQVVSEQGQPSDSDVTAKPIEENVESAPEEKRDEVEAGNVVVEEPTKEGENVADREENTEAKTDDSAAAPTSEDKSDAPLITV